MVRYAIGFIIFVATTSVVVSCQKASEESASSSAKYLYISTGQTNSGIGITSYSTQTSSRKISKLNLSNNTLSTVLDLSQGYQGGTFNIDTGAQAIVDEGNSLLMLTENAVAMSDRKVFRIPKSNPYATEIYAQDALALTQTAAHITRSMAKASDGSILISKSIAAEKIGTNFLRIPQGANPWVNAPAAPCATSNALISDVELLPVFSPATSEKIVYAHAGATTALNRLGVISENGYSVAANCLTGVQISTVAHRVATNIAAAPAVTFDVTAGANPVAMVIIPTSDPTVTKLIVAYSQATAALTSNNVSLNHAIVMWTINETAGTATFNTAAASPIVLNRDISVVFGISALAYDQDDNSLYVATAAQPGVANQTTAGYGYKIEKFTLDLAAETATLVRPNNQPFMVQNSNTKGITSLSIGSQ